MFRLYIDEVGTDTLTRLDEDNHRYLSLTGIAIQVEHARDTLEPNMNWIKANIFKHDPDAPLVFHRKDIPQLKGPYGILRDEGTRALFNRAMLRLFESTEYSVITALIDKEWMVRQEHWAQTHPYHYLMEILVEKYAQFLERRRDRGDLMPESRARADRFLQAAYDQVRARGTAFVTPARIASAIPATKLKFRTKRDNIAGLQLCDLLAHPSHMHTRRRMRHDVRLGPFAEQIIEILTRAKYDRSHVGKIVGYGIKHLPQ